MIRRDNLIGIEFNAIKKEVELEENSKFEFLNLILSSSNRLKNVLSMVWGGNANIYMQIKNTNYVLFHVQNGYCVIIPREIRTCAGETIDVVEEMMRYYYSINSHNNVITNSNGEKSKLLYRQLMALKYYGDILVDLPEDFEVHHKINRYIHTDEAMLLVDKNHHDVIHTITTEESHRRGRVIYSVQELQNFIDDTVCDIVNCKNIPY